MSTNNYNEQAKAFVQEATHVGKIVETLSMSLKESKEENKRLMETIDDQQRMLKEMEKRCEELSEKLRGTIDAKEELTMHLYHHNMLVNQLEAKIVDFRTMQSGANS